MMSNEDLLNWLDENFKTYRQASVRGIEWLAFAIEVLRHIENYTVPQYGDAPDDQIHSWTDAQCVAQIGKYAARFGRNARYNQEKLDLLKIAHYACLAFNKLEKE